MKKKNIQKMPKAGQAGNGTKPHVSGSLLLFELMLIAAIKNEEGMPIVHYVDKPNGGSVAYLRHDAVVSKLNSMLKLLPPADYLDWVILREKYFSDCVVKDSVDGQKLRIDFSPHDLFQWFKKEVEAGLQ